MPAPDAPRPLLLLLLLVAGLAHGALALFVVRDSNGTACIMANFSATFWMSYTALHGSQNTSVVLPSSAKVLNSSSCGQNGSEASLTIAFREGFSLMLNFTRNETIYSVQLMRFVYNLSDTQIFPNASSSETKTVDSKTSIKADIDKKYRCASDIQVHMGDVLATLHDTTIQAYLSNSTFSTGETHCKQDQPSPTTMPPSPRPPSPVPPSPLTPRNPSVSKYNVTGDNGTCLLVDVALQLNVTYTKKDNTTMIRVFNINQNETSFAGSCGDHIVTLNLWNSKGMTLVLQFGTNTTSSMFFLQGVQLNLTIGDAREPTFRAGNSSLRALQATVGNSYKCSSEEQIQVTAEFSLNVFSIWVQAFKVEGDRFGSVEECVQDGNNMLIPIAVGGALAGLVLVVLIAYLIGRKRSHAGYQTI